MGRPDAAAIARAYPREAAKKGIEGQAVIACRIGPDDDGFGDLVNCTVVSETPDGQGFGNAALNLAKAMRMRRRGDSNVGATVRIPIAFHLPH